MIVLFYLLVKFVTFIFTAIRAMKNRHVLASFAFQSMHEGEGVVKPDLFIAKS